MALFNKKKRQPEPDSPSHPKPKLRNKGALFFMGAMGFLTFAGGIVLAAYAAINYQYEAVSTTPSSQTVFTVKKGSGLSRIASDLEAAGLIESAFVFKFVTKLRGNESRFKAGEYAVETPISMAAIFETLSEGKAILYPFTAPEGLTSAQIMRRIVKVGTLINDQPDMPAEGTLLPETYLTPRGMAQSELIRKMQDAQREAIDALWETRQAGLPITTKRDAIILASVVEKETGIGSERDKVAGVFINRLNRGMRLESDPTIIYGISKGEPLGRGLRRSEIDRKTDWNTYQINGLPKTAICNPGREAIAAVLNPAKTDAIFFVADGTGGHAFARTLREHNANVAKWRRIERQRNLQRNRQKQGQD